ncbi:MAG: hypothetical protein RMK29_14405 [Myxococcales bacterium]|nr:hypothetical protein [Myxococcota bacterium]MDW8282903.1 hypothetical protein [Myxococcales bacterium]
MKRPLLVLAAALGVGQTAVVHATLRCADLPSPIYVAGSEAVLPLLRLLAPLLLADPDQATIVFQLRGGCAGVEAIVRDTDPQQCQQGGCIVGRATFYTQDGVAKSCELAAGGSHVHLAVSEVFARTCPGLGGGQPRGIVDLPGPVSPLVLVVPRESPERAIHAEEAHFVFGFGRLGGVTPWTNEEALLIQDERASTQVLLGLHIQVPPGRFKGVHAGADVIARLLTADSHAGLAFVPSALADARRNDIKILAYQAIGQRGAFFPDRTAASFDKQNVRDGHYPLWGYLHAVGRADPRDPERFASGQAQRLADLLLGRQALGGTDPLLHQVRAGLVPQCAMTVARADDHRPLVPYIPLAPCGCWFEKNVPMGQTRCRSCTDDTACGEGRCRRGFCEVR